MKCRICGTELTSDAKICPMCDTPVTAKVTPVRKQESKFGRIIRRFDYKAEGTAQLIMYFLLAGFFLVLDLGALSVAIAILTVAEGAMSKHLYNSRFLSVNEYGVAGIGQGASAMGFFDYKNEHFEFMYADIVSIKKETLGTKLCIDTIHNKVSIQLPYLPNRETKEAIEAIERASGLKAR